MTVISETDVTWYMTVTMNSKHEVIIISADHEDSRCQIERFDDKRGAAEFVTELFYKTADTLVGLIKESE